MLTESQIRAMMPRAGKRLDPHLPYIGPALEAGAINTPRRIAAFMAQLAHESGEYQYMEEIADGRDYEWRADLGNVHAGDGPLFKGHGPIQITGRTAHRRCGEKLGLDLLSDPLLICRPEYGTRAAVWFWNDKMGGLSCLADVDWFLTICRYVNGGENGLADRLAYWRRNREILGLPPVAVGLEPGAIKAFQAAHGLLADGIAGQQTMSVLRQVQVAA